MKLKRVVVHDVRSIRDADIELSQVVGREYVLVYETSEEIGRKENEVVHLNGKDHVATRYGAAETRSVIEEI